MKPRVSGAARCALAASAALIGVFATAPAAADEGGVGLWLPGLYGSLAATQQVPGWSLGITGIGQSVSDFGNAHVRKFLHTPILGVPRAPIVRLPPPPGLIPAINSSR
jgi:hypothetical protein